MFALDMLIIACPCALVISTPITYVAALAQAARRGILIKGGTYLESLGNAEVIAFDKTGTLTEGEFKVAHVRMLSKKEDRSRLLQILHAVETCSNHPFAVAACRYVESEISTAKSPIKAEDFEILEGEGVRARVGKSNIVIANRRVFKRMFKSDQDIPLKQEILSEAENWETDDGATVVWMFENNIPVALFGATDLPRKEAAEAVSILKKMNVRTIMLTGDNDGAARVIQRVVGVSERRSKLLPREKVDAVREIKFSSTLVGKELGLIMVGDGVNDAPALALSDVGVAMGVTGTVVAMETADVALMDNDLRKIPEVITLGRNVISKIRQNVTISIVSKAFVMALALAGYVYLWLAILVDVGGMIVVTLNGLSLLKAEAKKKKDDCCSGGGCSSEKKEKKKDDCCSGGGCSSEKKKEKKKDDCCSGGGCSSEKESKKKDDCCSGGGCSSEKKEKKKDDCCSDGGCSSEKEVKKKDDCCSSDRGCSSEKKDLKKNSTSEMNEVKKEDDCCSGETCSSEKKKDLEKNSTSEKKDSCCSEEGECSKKKKKKRRKKKKKKNSMKSQVKAPEEEEEDNDLPLALL
jgi:magnesium-transporting ATPase (P-type)